MPSSQNILNPGLSVWAFYPLGFLFGTKEPVDLARGVQWCNVVTLLLLCALAFRRFAAREREWWLWAAALASVNPLTVLFHRKIWPPSVLPLAAILMFFFWSRREGTWMSFGWGLAGLLAGQINASGFFFAAGLAAWTLLFDRARVAWRGFLAGCVVGALPLLPWLAYLATTSDQTPQGLIRLSRIAELKFFSHWMTEPFGIGLEYALGAGFTDFLEWPLFQGRRTWVVAGLHVVAGGIGLWLVGTAFVRWWRSGSRGFDAWTGVGTETTFLVQAAFWGYGLLLTASGLRFNRHYLVVAAPLMMVWTAWLALPLDATERLWNRGRRILLALCLTEASLTAAFLSSIHSHGGAPGADYGKTYATQAPRAP